MTHCQNYEIVYCQLILVVILIDLIINKNPLTTTEKKKEYLLVGKNVQQVFRARTRTSSISAFSFTF